MYRKIVVKLTGHLFDRDRNYIELVNLINFIKHDYLKNKRIYYIVVGGGGYARLLIENMRKQGVNEYLLDEIGIEVSRIHARFILNLLKPYTHEKVPTSIYEIALLDTSKTTNMVLGGLSPGFSTNAVSVLTYLTVKADLLLTMSVAGGLFDKDPEKYQDANLIKEVHISRIKSILERFKEEAGYYPLLDKTSLKLMEKNKVNMYILPPTVNSLKKVLEGGNPGSKVYY